MWFFFARTSDGRAGIPKDALGIIEIPSLSATVRRKSDKEVLKLFTCAYHGTRRFVAVCEPVNEIEEGTDEVPGNGERV